MAFSTVGKALPRIEGEGKVTGQTKYAADLPFEGLLWAKILRSSIPHGKIKNINTAKAEALAGVRAVLTGADVADVYVGTRVKDQPVLVRDKVRMNGDAVAAVAAESVEIAEQAITLIDVEYEELPYVEDPVEALKPSAPLIHDDREANIKTRQNCRKVFRRTTSSPMFCGKTATSKPVSRRRREYSSILSARHYRITVISNPVPARCTPTTTGASKCGRQTKVLGGCANRWPKTSAWRRRKSKSILFTSAATSALRHR